MENASTVAAFLRASLPLSLLSPQWPSLGLAFSMKLSTALEPLFTPLF